MMRIPLLSVLFEYPDPEKWWRCCCVGFLSLASVQAKKMMTMLIIKTAGTGTTSSVKITV